MQNQKRNIYQNGWGNKDGFPFNPQNKVINNGVSMATKTGNNISAISLEPTINFEKMEKGGMKAENVTRSWVDDWK